MRKNLNILLTVFVLPMLMFVTSFAAVPSLIINNQVIETSTPSLQENGVTLVPLRTIGDALDTIVSYHEETQGITLTKGDKLIKLTLGSTKAFCNGTPTSLSLAPRLVNGITMVPLRFISESLDCLVKWDSKAQTVTISSQESSLPLATLIIKDLGTIKAELYPSFAPNTVNNFIDLANEHFYDGLTFHRVIDDFMIQGGCPLGNGTGGPGYSISGEFASNGFIPNTLSHTPGILSMARSTLPDSAGSQFFIMTSSSPHLNGDYAAFGKIISGMDIVEQIKATPTDGYDKPLTPIVIKSIRVDTQGIIYSKPTKLR